MRNDSSGVVVGVGVNCWVSPVCDCGSCGTGFGDFQLPYPFLSFEQDPFLLVFTGVTGVLMSLSLGALGVLSLLPVGMIIELL